MLNKILNRFGYYKMDQLDTGGWCGCCGKRMEKEVFPKHWEKHILSRASICDECM
jgi:hypothetical protein